MRIALIAHSSFYTGHAMHVYCLSSELRRLGHDCVMVVPDTPESDSREKPSFPIVDYEHAVRGGLPFVEPGNADLVHAWTPREHLRVITERLTALNDCPYFVHLEDNEEQIVADRITNLPYSVMRELPSETIDAFVPPYWSHPRRYRQFLEGAAGCTCIIEKLQEFVPRSVPAETIWAGFEEAFGRIGPDDRAVRARYGIGTEELIILYTGAVHASVAKDVRNLVVTVGLLHRHGHRVRMVRTGRIDPDSPLGFEDLPGLSEYLVELGFVAREEMPLVVGMSDILVQPGRSDAFNDYRFPAKLPEYLASSRPVILPDSNIGVALTDGREALKLYKGTISELTDTIERLILNPELRRELGARGRHFAVENLTWARSARRLEAFYRKVLGDGGSVGFLLRPSRDRGTPAGVPTCVKTDCREGAAAEQVKYPVQLIAHYLPQFHPIPENDRWWGTGFTEWTNVVRAKPNFSGHDQPRLPTELGFYDLRLSEVMKQQANLARQYGVNGFCFYYYWFDGMKLLSRPVEQWLADKTIDFPFCLCWANEHWSRRWDGSEHEILMEQHYTAANDERLIREFLPYLHDPRYIRVDGAPIVLVYRVAELPDAVGMAARWRRVCAENDIPRILLAAVQSFGISDPRPYGFDAAIEFSPPHVGRLLVEPARVHGVNKDFAGYLEDYIAVAMNSINSPPTDYMRFRGVFPCWDNTPRLQAHGHILINDSPKAYGQWLRFLVREALHRADQQAPLVFLNAWNEWAEGTYLEPDERYGRTLLEVTRAALCEGIIDHVNGPHPDRERDFTARVSRLPYAKPSVSAR